MATRSLGSPVVAPAHRSAPSSFMRQRSLEDVAGGGRRAMGWDAPGSGPNAALLAGLGTTRSRSRQAVGTNTTAKRLVDNLVVNVIDTGIRPRTRFPDLQKLWERWTDEADSRGQLDFYGMQALAFRSMVEGGDCFVRFRSRRPGDMDTVPLQLQILEAEHCPSDLGWLHTNGNIVSGGVERDGTDYPAAYWLYRHHPRDTAARSGIGTAANLMPERIDARDVCHLMQVLRPGEDRGQPWLKTALIKLRDVDIYDDAEVVRKQGAAMHGGYIKTAGNEDDGAVVAATFGGGAVGPGGIVVDPLEPGTFPVLPPGLDVEFSKPADLGGQYEAFMRQQLSSIAVSVSSTYEQLSMDWRGTNDRTYRASMLEFSKSVRSWQWHLMVFQFCRPVWRRFVVEAIASGAWKMPAGVDLLDVLDCRWDVPARGYINPLQEVAAYIAAVAAGFTSRERVANELGNEASEIDLENAASRARAEAVDLQYSVFEPQTAAGATIALARLEAQGSEGSEVQDTIKAAAVAEVSEELAKIARPGPRLRPASETACRRGGVTTAADYGFAAVECCTAPRLTPLTYIT